VLFSSFLLPFFFRTSLFSPRHFVSLVLNKQPPGLEASSCRKGLRTARTIYRMILPALSLLFIARFLFASILESFFEDFIIPISRPSPGAPLPQAERRLPRGMRCADRMNRLQPLLFTVLALFLFSFVLPLCPTLFFFRLGFPPSTVKPSPIALRD